MGWRETATEVLGTGRGRLHRDGMAKRRKEKGGTRRMPPPPHPTPCPNDRFSFPESPLTGHFQTFAPAFLSPSNACFPPLLAPFNGFLEAF